MDVEVIHGAQVFNQVGENWDDLVREAMTSTPFQTLAYQRAWWTHLGPGDLHSIIVRAPSGNPTAIGCFFRVDGVLCFNGSVEESDYLDLITTKNMARKAWALILDAAESDRFSPWKQLDLCNVPSASPTLEILQELAHERGYTFVSTVQEVCPVLTLPESYEEYLMALDKKQRHEVRRKGRRAKAAGAELMVVSEDADVTAEVNDFLALLAMSTAEKEDWLNEGRRAVFQDIAAAMLPQGRLQLLFLKVGDKKAAGLYNFDYNDRIWVYNSGFDIVEFGRLSPGVVLTAGAIEQAITVGRKTFDFLRGDEEYKYRFGAESTTVHRIIMSRAS